MNYLSTEEEEFMEYNSDEAPEEGYNGQNEDSYFDDKNDFDPFLDRIMFAEANFTVREVMVMVNGIFLRFGLPIGARHAIMNLAKCLAGPAFESWSCSKHNIAKVCDPPPKTISYVFFCPSCNKKLNSPIFEEKFVVHDSQCNDCGKVYTLRSTSLNYVVKMDLRYQLQTVLQNTENLNEILYTVSKIKRGVYNDTGIWRDVYDGKLYKKILELHDDEVITLTMNFNFDGMQIFKNSSRKLWPCQGIINEFSPFKRFRTFLTLMLFITETEPSADFMHFYQDIFIDMIEDILTNPVVVYDTNGQRLKFVILPLCACVDAPARAILQNRLQYNGYYGCSWCYIFGKHVGCVKFPISDKNDEIRTNESHQQDVTRAIKAGKEVRGVKGSMALSKLRNFDCVWSFPVEELHNVFVGVVKYLWLQWTLTGYDTTNPRKAEKITSAQVVELDRRLSQIRLPNEIHRWFHSLSKPSKLKASEWKSFLLIHAPICLEGILPPERLQSLILLSQSIFSLLESRITEDTLNLCEIYLTRFVGDVQMFYGESAMTYNVHTLLHFVHSVKMAGPLWSISAFPFESHMNDLRKQALGPAGVYQQISKRTLGILALTNLNKNISSNVNAFCKDLFSSYRVKNVYHDEESNAVLIGEKGNIDANIHGRIFDRCIYRYSVYRSTAYSRSGKNDDSVVLLHDDTVLQISRFECIENHCYIVGHQFRTEPVTVSSHGIEVNISFYQKVVENLIGDEIMLGIENIKEKLINVRFDEEHYVVRMPGSYEIQ